MSDEQPKDKQVKATKADIEEFMGKPMEKMQTGVKVEAAGAPTEEKPLEIPEEPKEIRISGEKALANDTPTASNVTTFALERPEEVEVTEEEKVLFLKAIMNDTSFTLTIGMMGGLYPVKLRTRTAHEQNMIISTIDLLGKEGEEHSFIRATSILQEFILCVTLVSMGNKPFPNVIIDPGHTDIAEIRANLDRVVKLHIAPMGQEKLSMLIKAVQIFESKKLKMQEECLNQDFWNPVD